MLQGIKVGNKYEWIKGENFGQEEIVKNTEVTQGSMRFVEFVSGRRINQSLTKEYLSLIAEISELDVEDTEKFVKELEIKTGSLNPSDYPSPKNDSIFTDILDKIKSYESVDIKMNFSVSLPKKAALEILIDAYGEDLKNELNVYIKNKISDDIKENVHNTINAWIEQLIKTEDENNQSTEKRVP